MVETLIGNAAINAKQNLEPSAHRGQLPAHTDVWTPGAAGLRAVCPPLPDTDAAPVDNRKRLTHRCLALPGRNKVKGYGRQQPPAGQSAPYGEHAFWDRGPKRRCYLIMARLHLSQKR